LLHRFASRGHGHASATPMAYSAAGAAPDGVVGLLAAYASGAATPADTLRMLRDRIEASPTGLAAVLGFVPDAEAAALDSAARWREGRARPLEGIPVGVKDIIDVAGAKVTCGSLLTGERVAAKDAGVVAKLRAAGAIPFAMLATSEFACGGAHNRRYGAVPNPYNSARWTGGSSTGSGAALAARLAPLALGSDTGGSIRIPAAWCGVSGLKPTRELVSRAGVAPLSWTLDHVGPMARSAADLAAVMPWISGEDDPASSGGDFRSVEIDSFAGLCVGVPTHWFDERCDAAVIAAWRYALELMRSQGARLIDIDVGDVASAHSDGWTILLAELASIQAPAFDRIDLFDPGAKHRILQGREIPAREYLDALRRRPLALKTLLAALAEVDVLVTPGAGGEAGFLDTLDVDVNGERIPFQDVVSRNTMIFDYTGLPALMLPAGVGATGLPVAIQIVGKPYADGLCLAIGVAFQRLTEYHLMKPPGVLA
jgi:aspartyl-tRNA(Asn)/glutamyl-tRNA(Gln) amidotransferase subunit A